MFATKLGSQAVTEMAVPKLSPREHAKRVSPREHHRLSPRDHPKRVSPHEVDVTGATDSSAARVRGRVARLCPPTSWTCQASEVASTCN